MFSQILYLQMYGADKFPTAYKLQYILNRVYIGASNLFFLETFLNGNQNSTTLSCSFFSA
jgi:hypothetical protein